MTDNYVYLLRDNDAVGVVDPADAAPVIAALEAHDLKLTHIFNTHHHADHIDGNAELKKRYGAAVVAPRANAQQIPMLTQAAADGDHFEFGGQTVRVLGTPGHTLGHLAYWFPEAEAVFTGDTLFAAGCGRLFEGTAQQMWDSLKRLRGLPGHTRVYCGHEYTLSNVRFALTIDPKNEELAGYADTAADLRAEGKPTIPTTIGAEREINPFLRADDPRLQAGIGMAGASPVSVFGEIRRRKDHFKG
ncbi:MAG TPA: hydroxyacylglutathione hydrolase [Azospirillaceae bacterium]|nr:hydroxyacylglutathione hydrolase [Azospirillaceae bacterium]